MAEEDFCILQDLCLESDHDNRVHNQEFEDNNGEGTVKLCVTFKSNIGSMHYS